MKCVLFRTVSEIELFECTTAKLLIRKIYSVYIILSYIFVRRWEDNILGGIVADIQILTLCFHPPCYQLQRFWSL